MSIWVYIPPMPEKEAGFNPSFRQEVTLKAWVLQQDVEPDKILVYGERRPPQTALIPGNLGKLRKHRKQHLLEQAQSPNAPQYSLVVSPQVVAKWNLAEGDLVELNQESADSIISVNGCNNPNTVANWPMIAGEAEDVRDTRTYLSAQYPIRPLRVEKFGSLSLRVLTLLAPIGKGQSIYLAAPGGSGKTTILLDLWEALLRLTLEDSNLYPIVLHLGERSEDFTDYQRVWDKVNPARGEKYTSPREDPLHIQVQIFEFVIKRARRLAQAGYDVVFICDSVTRAVMAHSRSTVVAAEGGMISGGIYTSSIQYVAELLGVAGDFGDRSLTMVSSVLLAAKDKKSSEAAFTEETMDSGTTCKWVLTGMPMAPYPKVDVSQTRTRRIERFATQAQQAEIESVNARIWATGGEKSADGQKDNSLAAHRRLVEYAQKNPNPIY